MRGPVLIDDKETREFVLSFLTELRLLQENLNSTDTIIYSPITLSYAIKNKILSKNFLLHPLVKKQKKFYEITQKIETNEKLVEVLSNVLMFELTSNETFLSTEERDELILIHKKLAKKSLKKDTKNFSNAE